jgi:type IV pilus assembly protein PilC
LIEERLGGIMKKNILNSEYVSSFCLEVSLFLHAGIGLEEGLYLLIEDERDKKCKLLLKNMANELSQGKPMSEVVYHTGAFPKYVYDMILTGEETGRLEQTFHALSDYYERQTQMRNQIQSAILYPVILAILLLIILVTLLVKVLPIFEQVYRQLGGGMTGTAQLLLHIGSGIGRAMPILCGGVCGILLSAVVLSHNSGVRAGVLKFYRRIFGKHTMSARIGKARVVSAMALGLQSGLNTEKAFRMAMVFQDVIPEMEKRYEQCLKMLESGETLAISFKENRILEEKYCRFLDLGVKSGMADIAMTEVSRRMNEKIQTELERKVGRIEPALVILSSLMVGLVLIVVMLPLIDIMSSI